MTKTFSIQTHIFYNVWGTQNDIKGAINDFMTKNLSLKTSQKVEQFTLKWEIVVVVVVVVAAVTVVAAA